MNYILLRTEPGLIMNNMKNKQWMDTLDASITVCGQDGEIIYMNETSAIHYQKDGGRTLMGKNLLACHPGDSQEVVRKMLQAPVINLYITDKNGQSTLVYQAPWFRKGKHAGIVEMLIPLPEKLRRMPC
jgi:transcriptional regulator with PAS, ATPase and Fis domain